jgi:uncharacterized repeat protein (TIGR01451 family)
MRFSATLARTVVFAVLCIASNAQAGTLIRTIGSTGSGDGQFAGVNGIAVDERGRIYAVDSFNARVQVFDSEGVFQFAFGSLGVGDGQFGGTACGIAVNTIRERVYVSEGLPGFVNHRVQIFDFAGNFIRAFGSEGIGAGQFDSPCQIAIRPSNGDVYVVDSGNQRVQYFDFDGSFLGSFGEPGTAPVPFNRPSGIAFDPAEDLYVADSFDNRIRLFTASGTFISEFGSMGSGIGEFHRPCHLAMGPFFVYVADGINSRVQVIERDGTYRDNVSPVGTLPSRACDLEPLGLATDKQGRIYVENGNRIDVYTIDRDGDGLLDTWEESGLDVNNDGVIDSNDVDLPALGADPDHKDLFLELDYVTGVSLRKSAVAAMKAAFARAPVDAGGVPNPDGLPGINLWVDVGGMRDSVAREGLVPGTCANGIDDDGDGLTDGNDASCLPIAGTSIYRYLDFDLEDTTSPTNCSNALDDDGDGFVDGDDTDCIVGDDFGGGNEVPGPIGCLDDAFYDTKAIHFDARRALVFRYGIAGNPADGAACGGGFGEIGGNDFVEYNHDGGTIMHELGHTLNLDHGGDNDDNCKPNYVSAMNYDNQFGVRRNGGGIIIDYSPARLAIGSGNRAVAPLDDINEGALNEAMVLDATDQFNQFAFVDGMGNKQRWRLDSDVNGDGVADGINWDGDTDPPFEVGVLTPINVDTSDAVSGVPARCTNSTSSDTLSGHDDWSNIALDFKPFGDSEDGAINPVTEPELTSEELEELERAFHTTDLSISKSAAPDPVEVGDNIVYTIVASNIGGNPANPVGVSDTLPPGAAYVSDTAGCTESGGVLDCTLPELMPTVSTSLDITVSTAGTCEDGVPQALTNTATVHNASSFAGDDRNPADNVASVTVTPVDTTAPTIDSLSVSPGSPWAPNHKMRPIAVTAEASDACDAAPRCQISGIESNEADNGAGDGNWEITGDLTALLRAERSGRQAGRIYVLTVTCTDGSNNSSSGEVEVRVAHDRRR